MPHSVKYFHFFFYFTKSVTHCTVSVGVESILTYSSEVEDVFNGTVFGSETIVFQRYSLHLGV